MLFEYCYLKNSQFKKQMIKRQTFKKITTKNQHRVSTEEESKDVSMNCSCQILCDTSLSQVSDSDCSCSQCLEAHLEAFNEFKGQYKEQQEQKQTRTQSLVRNNGTKTNLYGNRIGNSKNTNRNSSAHHNKNMDYTKTSPNQYRNIKGSNQNNNDQTQYYLQDQESNFTTQNLNDYILITKQRTKNYLKQRKNAQIADMKQKQELKKKVKQNLQILKYTVKAIQQHEIKQNIQNSISKNVKQPHTYKWNHTPYICQCNGKLQGKHTRKCCHRVKHIEKLDTNLEKIKPQFQKHRDQILESVKQQRILKLKEPDGCAHDFCPNHHMRTSPRKIQKIEKFIKKQAAKYIKKEAKRKRQEEEKLKIKKAKLRAINLKCKDLVSRSRKIDDNISRTSFQLSADHFSTFSQLRVHKQQRDQQRKRKTEVRKQLKQKGGKLQMAIYQDIDDNQVQTDKMKQIQQKISKEKKKKIDQENQQGKQWCQKITKDAKISSPKKIKQGDTKHKNMKRQKHNKHITILEEEKKQKQKGVQLQIQKKKRDLMNQYKKQKKINENSRIKKDYNQYLEGPSRSSIANSRRSDI